MQHRTLESRFAAERRRRQLRLALCVHPFTSTQLLALNPTFAEPFSVQEVHHRRGNTSRTYRQSRQLLRALAEEQKADYIAKSEYAVAGFGIVPYYRITRAGYRSLTGKPLTERQAKSAAFRPISHAHQPHQRAVAESAVHTMVEAARSGLGVTRYVTRHQTRLELPVQALAGTALAGYVRRNSSTGEPMTDALTLYPDADFRLRRPDGSVLQFYDEIDGSTETVMSDEDIDAVQRKIRFYHTYAKFTKQWFTVRFLTYRPNTFGRARNLALCARATIGSAQSPLFLFGTLDRYLATRGALVRRCVFFDPFSRPAVCVPISLRHRLA